MPRDENGVFTPLRDWEADAAAGTPFSPDRWNAQDADFASALNDLPLAETVPTFVPPGTPAASVRPGSMMRQDGIIYVRPDEAVWMDVSSAAVGSLGDEIEAIQEALAGKAPLSHTHPASAITDFAEATDDRVAALLQAGDNVALVYDDAGNKLKISANDVPFNIMQCGGRFMGRPEPASHVSSNAFNSTGFSTYNGSSFSAGGKFKHNNSTFGGSGEALAADVEALVTKIKTGPARANGVEWHIMNITSGTGTVLPETIGGTTGYVSLAASATNITVRYSANAYLRAVSGSVVIPKQSDMPGLWRDGVAQSAGFVITPENGWVQVTYRVQRVPAEFIGFGNVVFRYYGTHEGQFQLALPTLYPGYYDVEGLGMLGYVSSLTGWR